MTGLLISGGGGLDFFRRAGGLLEALDPLAQRSADLGEFTGAKNDKDDHKDHQKLGHAYSKHGCSFLFRYLLVHDLDDRPGNVKH